MELRIEGYKGTDVIHLLTAHVSDTPKVEGLIARYKRYTADQDIHTGRAAGKHGLNDDMFSVYSTKQSFKQNIFECLLYDGNS